MNVCPHWLNAATTTIIVVVVSAIFIPSQKYYTATLYIEVMSPKGDGELLHNLCRIAASGAPAPYYTRI